MSLIKIKFPLYITPNSIEKRESHNDTIFYFSNLDSDTFSIDFRSPLKFEFCNSMNTIVEKYFKNVKSYPFTIFVYSENSDKLKFVKIEIPINQIQFVIDNNQGVEIIFPEIKL